MGGCNPPAMVSVIIPSFNSEDTIESNLVALHNQTYESDYEIILVDSSTDSTPRIVRSAFPAVMLLHLNEKTDPGTARNLGVEKSSGDLLLFIDSDCVAEPDWIEIMVRLHEKHDHAAIGGSVSNGNDPRSLVAWAGYFAEFREFIPERPMGEVSHIPTCNISYKASIFKSMTGFNPDYYPQEDLEFNHRLCRAGHRILFSPEARIHHHHRTSLGAYLVHQHRTGRITARLLKVLPLEGSRIVEHAAVALLALPFLPLVKWLRTIGVFLRYNRRLIIRRFLAAWVLALGLIPWTFGFYSGVFSDDSTTA